MNPVSNEQSLIFVSDWVSESDMKWIRYCVNRALITLFAYSQSNILLNIVSIWLQLQINYVNLVSGINFFTDSIITKANRKLCSITVLQDAIIHRHQFVKFEGSLLLKWCSSSPCSSLAPSLLLPLPPLQHSNFSGNSQVTICSYFNVL